MRKTAKSNANSTFQMALDTLSKFKLLDLCKVNRTTFTITLPNGSVFLFYGCDDVEKIKSIAGITDIICEECSELSIDDVSQLDLRLRARVDDLQMFFMFNPVSKANWTYKRWFADGANVDATKTTILKTTYKDNKFLPQEYIESLEAMMHTNPTYFRIYALGEFCSLDKLVFNNWEVKDFNPKAVAGATCIGMDFGFTNDLSTLVASIADEENKELYVFAAWGETGRDNEQLAEIIKNFSFSKSLIIADSSEPKSISEIKKYGVARIKGATKGADSIIHGIQKLQQYQIYVHPSCVGLITELENYSWLKDKQTGEYVNKPIDCFNHYIDALRYSLQCLDVNKVQTFNKNLLGI